MIKWVAGIGSSLICMEVLGPQEYILNTLLAMATAAPNLRRLEISSNKGVAAAVLDNGAACHTMPYFFESFEGEACFAQRLAVVANGIAQSNLSMTVA